MAYFVYSRSPTLGGGGRGMSRALGAGRRPGSWHREDAKCMIPLSVERECVLPATLFRPLRLLPLLG